MRIATQKRISVFCAIVSLSFVIFLNSSKVVVKPSVAINLGHVIDISVDAVAVTGAIYTDPKLIYIPKVAKQLHGQRVRMSGVMVSLDAVGITQFLLIPETNGRQVICTSKNIPLHANIPVKVAFGATEDYDEQPITVEGIFEVHIQRDDQRAVAIYRLMDARIVARKVRLRGQPLIAMFGC